MGKLQKVIDKEFININLDTNTNGHFVWDTCVGKECAVKYNGEIYNIKILSYNKEKRSVYIRCNEKEYKENNILDRDFINTLLSLPLSNIIINKLLT